MSNDNGFDPAEKMMIARLANFFVDNIDYDKYQNYRDWNKQIKFWKNIAHLVNGENHIDATKFADSDFNYDPPSGVRELLTQIRLDAPQQFPELLQGIFEKLDLSSQDTVNRLNRYLFVFNRNLDENGVLTTSAGLTNEREADRHLTFEFLNRFPDEKESFLGALEKFAAGGSDSFRQSMSSCRTLIENLTKKLSNERDWKTGLTTIESSDTKRDLVKKTHHYLSAYGSHGDSIPSQNDTELGLKLTEDVVVWLIKNNPN